jgi:hypothetical protein
LMNPLQKKKKCGYQHLLWKIGLCRRLWSKMKKNILIMAKCHLSQEEFTKLTKGRKRRQKIKNAFAESSLL